MNEVLLIVGMVAVTYGIRVCLMPASKRMEFPPFLERGLRYVPPAVLTAIIVPAVLMPDGQTLDIHWSSPHLAGAVAACLVGGYSRNLLLTIVSGMAVFLLWPLVAG